MSAPLHSFGVFALESGAPLARALLDRDAASMLADHVSNDLQRLLPGVERLDLAIAAAAFDPAELLRPGWPRHAALAQLALAAPGRGAARVLGFGAADGAMPAGLQPDAALAGGALHLVPFALLGGADALVAVGRAMEERLLDTGMADASTALFAQTAFGTRLEHVRYMSVHDLCALTAMQYEHAGLGPLWPLIEAALLAPGSEEWLDAPPEPLARFADGEVRIALLDLDAWADRGFAPAGVDANTLSRRFDAFQRRQRQFAAVLGAHGIGVQFDHCPATRDPREVLGS
ncbi:hypothetical protein [Chiayiivirga flava]|uniref:Uncharacterized protein n=1 Tax=Chiayiivirga flava TaxID=659595 RepID=A0A7W8D4A5_9GAMM|nr:hypothetical protein [Chiayiivirga flava]MBB5207659.1 hypothetical protein [Chiayiivirga flava]